LSYRVTRRSLLAGTLALVAQAAAPLRGWSAAASPQVSALGEDLWLVQGLGAPLLVARSGEQLLLVDGGEAGSAKALTSLLSQRFPRARVQVLINTDWHADRSGYNEAAAAAGARLIATENTRLWMSTEQTGGTYGRVQSPRTTRARPTDTLFYGNRTLTLGQQSVEYGVLPSGHTDGDLYVWFAAQNVLFAGDMIVSRRYPVIDSASNGWLGGMVSALKLLMARCDAQTRVIDADGLLVGKADLLAQQDLCFTVLQRIAESYYKGETRQQFMASQPTREFDDARGDPRAFLLQAYDSAWGHINEIRRVTR
jgi:glyoxylase-like metal-dependent hydrolase (beta-lactamase superfamily II)